PFPLRDLVRMKLVLRRQFRNRPLAADRLKRNLGLELGRKPSACLHAGSSFPSGDPPYAPVSETGTTSVTGPVTAIAVHSKHSYKAHRNKGCLINDVETSTRTQQHPAGA